MRKQCTIVLLLITGAAAAQTTLPNSRQTSERRYLYRLSNEQAAAVARKGLRPAIAEAWLRQPVDSVAIDRPLPPLAPGNYLQVHAAGSQLQMQLVVQPNCQVKAMSQYRTLAVLVHDSLGQPISQANVLLRRKKLNFDPVTQTYRLRKARKDGLLQVQYNGLVNLHRLESEAAMHGHLWQKLKHAFPVRQFRQLFQGQQKKHRYRNYFRHEAAYQQKFHAYLVFSKPIYKPGDTVHFKAFIVPKRGKPVNRPLLLRLTSRDFKKDTIVTTLHPYRPGGYVGSLVLNDSLDLDLDEDYLLTLEETKSRRYNLSEYDGDWDDDNYALQRKILARGEFKLEEYQLNQISFQLRADKSNHGPGNLVSLFAKATDENDLPVPDGRLEVVVTTNRVLQYHRPRLFVPDTLWRHKQPLDPVGETRFSLPDSIFPAADLAYAISATFLNSNNEAQQQTLHQQYQYQAHQLLFQPYLDSLRISYQHLGNGRTQGATITQWAAQGQRIGTQRVQLPTAIWLNPFMESCTVQTDSAHATYTVQHSTATIQFFTRRTADSVFIYTSNPRQLPFWFTLLAGKRPLQKGYVRQLNIAQKSTTRQNYFLLVQYVWGNKLQKHEYYLPYHTKTLTLQVEQPTQVYPGEQRSISITVKDNCGRPVADADVTAWAFTKKFPSVREPKLPFVNKTRPGLGRLPWYQAAQLANTSSSTLLNWQRWGHSMGLDSIAYFQFLHPQPIYQSTASMGDSITQLAPFVIKDGILQPIHLLYIDEKPVFFSQANHIKRYSFRVSPGQHALRLRTHNRLVQIDSIWVQPGVKNFLSVAADHPAINTTTVPDTLTYHEQQHWARCMTVLKNNYGDNFASVQQGQAIWLLPQNQPYADNWRYNSPYDILVGPLMPQEALLQVKTDFEQPFMPEPSYSFAIQQGLVKQKSLPVAIPFVAQLGYTAPPPPLQEKVLTQTELDSLWQDYLDNRTQQQQIFNNPNIYSKSRVHIRVDSLASGGKPFVKNLLLFRYDRADFVRVYRGNVTDLGSQEAGWHKLLLLLKGGQYVLLDSLFVQPFGHNFFATGPLRPHAADSIGLRLNEIIDGWRKWANGNYYGSLQGGGTDITETFNKRHFSDAQLTDIITGRVTDHKGAPIHKASVSIRGLSVGVLSDDKGYFAIKVPPTGMLMLSAVGYETVFVPFKGSGNENITLVANQGKLAEVVVTGYSIQRKKSMAGALTNISGDQLQRLTGRVPGVQIKAVDLGNNTRIILRGLSSLNELKAPLYVVDGVVYEGNIAELDPSRFAALEFLKDGSALYGAAASDGVVIITTHKKGSPLLDSLSTGALEEPGALPNTLRRRFRDDGFWQPRLRTDANGQARFSVVFPDDITQWRSFYAAMTAQKQVGITEMGIRSYKPLSAVLALPSFLVQGDSSRFIGKVLNYTSDTALAIRSILINGKPIAELPIQVTNARIDTIEVKAVSTDSVAIQYTIRQSNGYLDGEERRVPVVRQGVTETQGVFAVLDSDTSFALPPFQPGSPVTFHAEASVLPILLDEVEKIKSYAYNCNEQLASKLQCLLLEKKIRQQLGQPFREEKNIQALITKLNQNRGRNFMWGWWAQNDPSLWITLHVVEALLQAEAMGYGTMLARQPVIDYLVLNQESLLNDDQLRGWLLLQRLGAKADYKKYGDSLAARFKPKGLYQQLQWIAAQQQLGRPVAVDSVLQWASATMLGNLYWGEESYRFFDNAVQNTLLAYQILRQQGGYETELKKIRYYFLEKRKSGQWRNTYESARILAIILPDLLKEAQGQSSPSLRISGSRQQTVTQFPFTIQWDGQDSLVLHKKAGLPVYVAAWQQQHNPLPQAHKGQFEVTTRFERNGLPINQLKAGEAVTLTATVQVKADADYVMVEIPIPAGCSYKSKQQSHAHNEVHREHFTSKLSIFCAQLTKGTYRFSAELMPRYTGSYHLNPAKAEMMYFPVFYGREGMKQVVIE